MKKIILLFIAFGMLSFGIGAYAGDYVTNKLEERNSVVIKQYYDFNAEGYLVQEEIRNGFGVKVEENFYFSETRVD